MDPVFLDLGVITIRWYGVMMAVGFIAALLNWTYLGRKAGKDVTYCSDLLFWVMISGILGARIAYICANTDHFLEAPLDVVRLDKGGLIFYGGLIGSLVTVYIFARAKKDQILAVYDFTATSVPLSHALGRIGCFLNGCCYGRTMESMPGGRFPVQLLEASLNLGLFAVLHVVYKRKKFNGMVAVSYLLIYSAIRFVTELMRGDPRMQFAGLAVAKVVSISLFVSGLLLLMLVLRIKSEAGFKPDSATEQE